MKPKLTHLDENGSLNMVDVGDKEITLRVARAEGWVRMPSELVEQLGGLKKGNAYEAARLAGIQAAKRTWELIPLCHLIALDKVAVDFEANVEEGWVRVESTVRCRARTGVEMEALTAVGVACLTLYDMGKAVSKGMVIDNVRLLSKSGGKSGDWQSA